MTHNPLLTFFLVVALGALIGAIPFGKLRFGAAGALFVGLAFSAIEPDLGLNMEILQSVGLALFVYTVGLSAGQTFFSNLRRQAGLLGAAAVVVAIGAVIAVVLGSALKIPEALRTGIYTGALTAAPALDTAARITHSPQAAVGYAFGYPLAVIVAILVVTVVTPRKWPGKKDTPSLAGQGLAPVTVQVAKAMPIRKIPGYVDGDIRCSYLLRSYQMRVAGPSEELKPGDQLVIVGLPEAVDRAVAAVGQIQEHHLADDRTDIVFEPLTVSNPDLYGASVAQINMPLRFGGQITRVRRGDLDLLAREQLRLEPADEVHVVVPREELDAVKEFFGDSRRKVSEVDALSVGLGLVLGLAAGLISIPMPGGQVFSLGPAAGPLVVGMILGALRRTGPLVWLMPLQANLTMRQLGLLFFLAALGLTAGPSFAALAFSATGVRAGVLAVTIALVGCIGIAVAGRLLGLSAPRSAGAVAGILGQPAVLAAANAQVPDERIESAYAALFAFAMIVKILLVPLVFYL